MKEEMLYFFKHTFKFKIHEETIEQFGNFIIIINAIQNYRITLAEYNKKY